MRIGLSSIVGDGFGNGSFVFGEVPSGGGVPAAGTLLSTLDDYELTVANYPSVSTFSIVNGGTTYTFPNQTGDVPIRADGSGGSYQDYTTVTDVKFIQVGVPVSGGSDIPEDPIYIVISGTSYPNGYGQYNQLSHNGSGGFQYDYFDNRTYVGYGIPFVINSYLESAGPFGSYIPDGRADAYWSDNNGGYFESTGGIIYDSTIGANVYRSNGGYFPYGTLIGSDEMSTYYWNGTGGYYTG